MLLQKMVYINFQMVICILENGKMIYEMVKGNKSIIMVTNMKESGKMILEQNMAHLNFRMVIHMRENGKIILDMAKVN